jgi:hypothetical protein
MSDTATVATLPACDLCPEGTGALAAYDARTVMGPWANLCEGHFQHYGVGLGTGRGQRLVIATKGGGE